MTCCIVIYKELIYVMFHFLQIGKKYDNGLRLDSMDTLRSFSRIVFRLASSDPHITLFRQADSDILRKQDWEIDVYFDSSTDSNRYENVIWKKN